MTMNAAIALLDEPRHLRLALSPLRRRLLERLQTPASATQVADELALGRQRVNYHLRALEKAGLLELVEERPRRGCVERIVVTRAKAFVVDPDVMAPATRADVQDRFAAEHLIHTAAAMVRDVARMQTQAQMQQKRLLTFAIDTDIRFATPADFERFTEKLARFVARESTAHASRAATTAATAATAVRTSAEAGRLYRIVIGAHPTPASSAATSATAAAAATGDRDESRRSRHRRTARRRAH